MKLTRRTLVLGGIAAPIAAQVPAQAQTWPSGIIKIIVPFPPGGTTDPIARMVQPGLQQRLNATLIIENKPGASGSVGTGLVVKSPPDGNTWLFVFDTHAVNPFLFNLPFDTAKDLDPVMLIGTAPNVLATHPSRPFNSLADRGVGEGVRFHLGRGDDVGKRIEWPRWVCGKYVRGGPDQHHRIEVLGCVKG
jgi:tripartite-type tricarboxylate transporter receptor subunit TctC